MRRWNWYATLGVIPLNVGLVCTPPHELPLYILYSLPAADARVICVPALLRLLKVGAAGVAAAVNALLPDQALALFEVVASTLCWNSYATPGLMPNDAVVVSVHVPPDGLHLYWYPLVPVKLADVPAPLMVAAPGAAGVAAAFHALAVDQEPARCVCVSATLC